LQEEQSVQEKNVAETSGSTKESLNMITGLGYSTAAEDASTPE